MAEAEEALRLGLELDEREDEAESEREREDVALARKMLEDEQAAEAACDKDEHLARQLESQLKAEAVRVAKLERRERQLAERKLCKADVRLAEQLAADIEEEENQLLDIERRDRRLAARLVKEESKALQSLPQTEEKLRQLSGSINGHQPVGVRARLAAKLSALRKGMSDITNQAKVA